jgi:hypothetical protein
LAGFRKTLSSPIAANNGSSRPRPDVLAVYTRPRDPEDLKATHRRDTRADPDETGPPSPLRLQVRAQLHRHKLTDHHTAVDYAHVLKDLADTHFAKL